MNMWLCKRDLSKECEGKYKDCVNCILDKIRVEIEQITDTMGVRYNPYVSKIDVLQIIDKYRESEDKEWERKN